MSTGLRHLLERGLEHHLKKEWKQAEELYRQYEIHVPTDPDVHRLLGTLYAQTDQFEKAEPYLLRAMAMVPSHPDPYVNLGAVYDKQRRYKEAEEIYQQWIAFENSASNTRRDFAPAVYYNYGMHLIRLGQYRLGWMAYEFGYAIRKRTIRSIQQKRWDGSPLKPDDTLMVFCEQGAGDAILMARFLPEVKRRCRTRLVLECDRSMQRLFESAKLADEVIAYPDGDRYMPCYATNQMSLPYLIGVSEREDVRSRPYIPRPVGTRRTKGGSFTVGICWRGNPQQEDDARRSIFDTGVLDCLKGVADRYVSLQYSLDENRPDWIEDVLDKNGDYLDTARYIAENVDVVVSVCTSLLHLCGAMGVPTIGLLNDYPYCIWGDTGQKTAWYDSVELIRQERPGDWAGVIERARERLKAYRGRGCR